MERSERGQKIYIESMEKSAADKATRLFPFVKPGFIADMGAGAGPLTELLARRFPESKILAVDNSPGMIRRLHSRFQDDPRIEIVESNVQALTYSEPLSTILFISVLHEVFSFGDYSHQLVIDTLKNSYQLLEGGGRLIIRDGVQPEQETMYVRPRHSESYERFKRFVRDFQVRPMVINEGTFSADSFVQHSASDFEEFQRGEFYFEMYSQDVSELLSKYFYSEENWEVELKEQFGIWTLREYQHVLTELGFCVVYAETYLLPYLLKTHYSKDFEVFRLENGQVVQAEYPPSTMILVAERPEGS